MACGIREDYIGHVNRFTAADHLRGLSLQEGLMHMQQGAPGRGEVRHYHHESVMGLDDCVP
jgi:hypothetical protein